MIDYAPPAIGIVGSRARALAASTNASQLISLCANEKIAYWNTLTPSNQKICARKQMIRSFIAESVEFAIDSKASFRIDEKSFARRHFTSCFANLWRRSRTYPHLGVNRSNAFLSHSSHGPAHFCGFFFSDVKTQKTPELHLRLLRCCDSQSRCLPIFDKKSPNFTERAHTTTPPKFFGRPFEFFLI